MPINQVINYFFSVILDDKNMHEMMRNSPNALVKFEVYSKNEVMKYTDKRLNRIKTKNAIPLGPWAKMVVESILLLLNNVLLGV